MAVNFVEKGKNIVRVMGNFNHVCGGGLARNEGWRICASSLRFFVVKGVFTLADMRAWGYEIGSFIKFHLSLIYGI